MKIYGFILMLLLIIVVPSFFIFPFLLEIGNLLITTLYVTLSVANISFISYLLLSPFTVNKKKMNGKKYFYINQSLFSIETALLSYLVSDKKSLFKVQVINLMIKCMQKTKSLPFHCISHNYTYLLLRQFERLGYIENLKSDRKCFLNINYLRESYHLLPRNRLVLMKSIQFEATRKRIDHEELKSMMKHFSIPTDVYYISHGKIKNRIIRKSLLNSISRQQKIVELKKERESLISNENEIGKIFIKK